MKRKTRKKRIVKRPDDRRNIIPDDIDSSEDILIYAPNTGLAPRDYKIPQELEDIETRFEEICSSFISKANPDQFNSAYMDALIDRIRDEAIKNIRLQRTGHERVILKNLYFIHNGDYAAAKSKLKLYLKDKENNEKELAKYRRIHWSGTSFEE